MKVKELREALAEFDDEMEVVTGNAIFGLDLHEANSLKVFSVVRSTWPDEDYTAYDPLGSYYVRPEPRDVIVYGWRNLCDD